MPAPPISRWAGNGLWWLAGLALGLAGAVWIARDGLRAISDDFDTQARIVHRLLSQQVVQYDAVLATLALLGSTDDRRAAEQRLGHVYPSIRAVGRRSGDDAWPDPRLGDAERVSRDAKRAALGPGDLAAGRYWLVMAAQPVSYALEVDLARAVPWADWPMDPRSSPVRVALSGAGGQQFVVQPGQSQAGTWHLAFHKTLASPSQDFEVLAERPVRLGELPWAAMGAWCAVVAAALVAARALVRQRSARRRAEERARFAQVARLNALGELAAGMAHELNQPLTAVLANTQAARRLLADPAASAEDLQTAQAAMGQAADQARRAAEVVGRLRRAIERPAGARREEAVLLEPVLRRALDLVEPERARQGVEVQWHAEGEPPAQALRASVDPVALEQILHNLLQNAMQALSQAPAGSGPRRIELRWGALDARHCVVRICDNGPGIAPDVLPRIFEPFFSTRADGLGLGLSLCETLAQEMGGALEAGPGENGRGACFTLRLLRA
ncbi:sensor histidine kinase [Variovorax sp.]|uniref:sensor histidine kinase n=1 Tax=Variovorax sp. TaxID=1871043 RepID=UPI002D660BB1|nr:ATP-binding protein [Variovorax sp.]HYP84811.1 ATP-binding protein [Variovorax sp.]